MKIIQMNKWMIEKNLFFINFNAHLIDTNIIANMRYLPSKGTTKLRHDKIFVEDDLRSGGGEEEEGSKRKKENKIWINLIKMLSTVEVIRLTSLAE